MKRISLKYIGIPVFISLMILYLCFFIPVSDIPDVSLDWWIPTDKVVHFIMYFGLSGATAINYVHLKVGRVNMTKLLIGAFLIPILYGGFIEIIQYYFSDFRTGSWDDFLANLLGSLAALPIVIAFKNYLIKNRFK